MTTKFILPDVLANWPWKRAINPYGDECRKASRAWGEAYHAFSPRAQKAFNLCDPELLACLAFPDASPGKPLFLSFNYSWLTSFYIARGMPNRM